MWNGFLKRFSRLKINLGWVRVKYVWTWITQLIAFIPFLFSSNYTYKYGSDDYFRKIFMFMSVCTETPGIMFCFWETKTACNTWNIWESPVGKRLAHCILCDFWCFLKIYFFHSSLQFITHFFYSHHQVIIFSFIYVSIWWAFTEVRALPHAGDTLVNKAGSSWTPEACSPGDKAG